MLYLTYKVNFYDTIDNTTRTEYGIIAAETLPLATEQINEFYGDDLIDVTLDIAMADIAPYTFSEEIYKTLNDTRNEYVF